MILNIIGLKNNKRMLKLRLFYYLLRFDVILSAVLNDNGCSFTKKFVDLQNSTFYIGGIVPAQRIQDGKYILNSPAIYWASAIVHTIQKINKNHHILPNIYLGFDIRDSRNEISCASVHALDFLLNQSKQSKLLGVVGPASSSLSTAVSSILLADFVPQVSYSSTSSVLSKRNVYRNFLRTVPSDIYQAIAIIDLLKHFGWNYVTLITSDDDYGYFGQEQIRIIAKKNNVCFSTVKIFKENIDLPELTETVQQIRKHSRVVILWCSAHDAIKIIVKTFENGIQNVTWLGTEQWASSAEIIQVKKSHNILILRLYHEAINNLEDDIRNSKMHSKINCKNPWYREHINDDCSQKQSGSNKLLPNQKQAQVVSAVYALAYGLHDYLNCSSTSCLANVSKISYTTFYDRILKAKFTIPSSNFTMEFNNLGEVVSPEYEYAYVFNNSFLKFGSWKFKNKTASKINIENSIISWSNNQIPFSTCSYNCPPGTYRVNSTVSVCCWICEVCPQNTVSTGVNQYECRQCSVTSIVNKNKTQCVNLEEIRLSIKKLEGLFIAIGSSIGVVCSIFVLGLYVVHWNTPLVKSSNREMSAIQLVSIMGLFSVSFLYYFDLTSKLCVIRTVIFGFLFTTVIAMVCIKTYRLVRVFDVKFSKLSRFLKNKFQIGFSFVLIFFQSLGVFLWYIYFPAFVVLDRYAENRLFFRVCDHEVFWGILLYNFLIAIACGYMAYRSRNLPEKFNDAQHISYAMFTVCIIWLSFLPLYKSLSSHAGQVAFISVNLVSSYSSLFILYSKKVILILFYPDLNNAHSFRHTAKKSVLIKIPRSVKDRNGATDRSTRSVVMFMSYDDAALEQCDSSKCDTRDINLKEETLNMFSHNDVNHKEPEKVPLNATDPLLNALEENIPLILTKPA